MAWRGGWRPTSFVTAKAAVSFRIGIDTSGSESTSANWRRGIGPSIARGGQGTDRGGFVSPSPRSVQLQAGPGALRHHQHLLRGGWPSQLRQARLQPGRQAAVRPVRPAEAVLAQLATISELARPGEVEVKIL